jgi:hypothetical protein
VKSGRGRLPRSRSRTEAQRVGPGEWENNRSNTKKAYNLYIDRIVDKWGRPLVTDITFLRSANCTLTRRRWPTS